MVDDTAALMELLNSTPVVDGVVVDQLSDDADAAPFSRRLGGAGDPADLGLLRSVRQDLQAVAAGTAEPSTLSAYLLGASRQPRVGSHGVVWTLEVADGQDVAVRLVLAWSKVAQDLPGRLRSCGNPDCRKFLLDRTRANSARWCSMESCGNRMKARRHRARASVED